MLKTAKKIPLALRLVFQTWQEGRVKRRLNARDQNLILESSQLLDVIPQAQTKTVRILCQCMADYSFYVKSRFFLRTFQEIYGGKIQLSYNWVLVPLRGKERRIHFFLSYFLVRSAEREKWIQLYQAEKCLTKYNAFNIFFLPRAKARQILSQIKNPKELEALKHDGYLVGDLIYDTYLRFAHEPTIKLSDPFLLEITAWAIAMLEAYEKIFAGKQFDYYITSYTAYIHHGIAVRVALRHGTQVLSLGAFNQLIVPCTPEFPFHKKNFHFYKTWFEQLSKPEQKNAIALGHAKMQSRLRGELDHSTAYMKVSAYHFAQGSHQLPPKTKTSVVIICHDFFDSPHIYGEMLFPDFWIWMNETLEHLTTKTDFEILVKPHPNRINGNDEIMAEIKMKFPSIQVLPPEINNMDLVARGLDLALSVYGTVAHELAYLGVPVLCCSANPHMSFTFCKTTLDRNEYFQLLSHPEKVPSPPKEDQSVAEFYYCHNVNTLDGSTTLFPLVVNEDQATEMLNSKSDEYKKRLSVMRTALTTVQIKDATDNHVRK